MDDVCDSNNSRESHKIGLIYIAPGQDHQRQFLQNERGSVEYERFLLSLGWEVDMRTFKGFAAGLDPRTTGTHSIYWASHSTELMFHVVTRMPSKPASVDPQQVHKKVHVGNDHVRIVWSEHSRDYRPTTISSQFNDVNIIIYPLKEIRPESRDDVRAAIDDDEAGLFRIQILSAARVPPFGPLQDGMLVSRALLAPMIRWTALNANRAVRYSTVGYGRPYPTRKKYIDDVAVRYAATSPQAAAPAGMEAFLTELFPPPPSPPSTATATPSSNGSSVASA
jgi:hypothetical protein